MNTYIFFKLVLLIYWYESIESIGMKVTYFINFILLDSNTYCFRKRLKRQTSTIFSYLCGVQLIQNNKRYYLKKIRLCKFNPRQCQLKQQRQMFFIYIYVEKNHKQNHYLCSFWMFLILQWSGV